MADMSKKLLAVLFGALICVSGSAWAADNPSSISGLGPEALAQAFAKEGPLTKKDIDSFIKMLPELREVQDAKGAAALAKQNGFTGVRLDYVMNKIMVGMMLASGAPEASLRSVPGFIKPTDEEMTLIKDRMPDLQKLIGPMGSGNK